MMKIYQSKEYLNEQLQTKNYVQISKENQVDVSTIQRYMRKHGLTRKRICWAKEELLLLKKNYEQNSSVYQLFPRRSTHSINRRAFKLGFKRLVRKRIYSVNHEFFKQFNPEMAYVLG